ncbi:Gibberellin 2-beta-dioxygenase 8 [Morus notabilis]|uniref:Gibberellin 2-beta-dioxygenase 8 n=2 Tax=Morus notabilis TaxID=981085 RepID=W9RRM0_9ROSA|nr:Gibberellin 2-beta-dioxygenase 8 [Morus notabilis]
MERFAKAASDLVKTLVEILAQDLGVQFTYFQDNCPPNSSYLRMNRYPPCPYSSSKLVFGLIPHTDTDFLSVVYEDQIGGLQLLKDGRWFRVKPNPEALVINIGDLFEALSNGVYKSVRHQVVATQFERFSAAYFFCPSDESMVESYSQPGIYRKFSFKEYKQQNKKDVQDIGEKVGLQRFLL